ncbi:MAG TPA: hypothetical protein VFT72_07805 [Opitutaceae bacterium]|nr:hypothetical protein [Opitutaceae bacterium]
MKTPSDPLETALADWRLEPTRNPRFRSGVWARIEAARSGETWSRYMRTHAASVALAFICALTVGIFSGRMRARAEVAAENGKIVAQYVRSLDARTMHRP